MALSSPLLILPKFLLYAFVPISFVPKLLSLFIGTFHLPDYTGLDFDYFWLSRNPAHKPGTLELFRRVLPPVIEFRDLVISDGCTTTSLCTNCVVCLCEFDEEDEIRPLIECSHIFHRSCLDRWMNHYKFTCPLCRTPLVRYDRFEKILTRYGGDR